ncbi:hypothetical protein [Conservatibacter flavescens]|nr:hypothetical protein [Conservatibacter flavescens]
MANFKLSAEAKSDIQKILNQELNDEVLILTVVHSRRKYPR